MPDGIVTHTGHISMDARGCSVNQTTHYFCSLGLFLAGLVFYSSTLIEPYYTAEFHLTSWQIGFAQSAVLFGAIIGAIVAGRLADRLGRHRLLVWNFLLLMVLGLLGGLAFDFYSLCLARAANGFLAGTLYPLCAAYLTEMTSHSSLARQSAFAMFINCLAAPVVCIIAIFLSFVCNDYLLWRVISVCHVLPAILAYLLSKNLPESSGWLLCSRKLSHPQGVNKIIDGNPISGISILFNSTNRHITICLMGSWFLMDIAYYGINFFLPYLLQTMKIHAHAQQSTEDLLFNNNAIGGTLIIHLFFALSAFVAIFMVEKINLIKLQQYGFFFASLSLFLLASYFYLDLHQGYLIIFLFILFNFALNVGPDVTTYLLSATSYPIEIRASGHGFVTGFAKFGSFVSVLFLPQLQNLWGYKSIILLLAICLFSAYVLTINFAKAIAKDRDITEADVIYEAH